MDIFLNMSSAHAAALYAGLLVLLMLGLKMYVGARRSALKIPSGETTAEFSHAARVQPHQSQRGGRVHAAHAAQVHALGRQRLLQPQTAQPGASKQLEIGGAHATRTARSIMICKYIYSFTNQIVQAQTNQHEFDTAMIDRVRAPWQRAVGRSQSRRDAVPAPRFATLL